MQPSHLSLLKNQDRKTHPRLAPGMAVMQLHPSTAREVETKLGEEDVDLSGEAALSVGLEQ